MKIRVHIEACWPMYRLTTGHTLGHGLDYVEDTRLCFSLDQAHRYALVLHRDIMARLIDRYLVAVEPGAHTLTGQAAEWWPRLRAMCHELAGADEWHIPGCRRIIKNRAAFSACIPGTATERFPALHAWESLLMFCEVELSAMHTDKAYLMPSIAA
jgi:hypothetical protein